MRSDDLLVRARRLLVVRDERLRDRDAQRQHLFRAAEPGIDLAHRLERADHQPGGDQQHDRQRDLGDDQRVARAVTLAAGARERVRLP